MPPEITMRIPSSTLTGSSIASALGTSRRKPLVGLGVVGTKTSSRSEKRGSMAPQRAPPVTKPMAKMSFFGYSTRMTRLNASPWSWETASRIPLVAP